MDFDLILEELDSLDLSALYERDFWSLSAKTDQEMAGIFAVSDALRELRERNYDIRIFASGLSLIAPSRFALSAAHASSMLGLTPLITDSMDLLSTTPDTLFPTTDLSDLRDRVFRMGEGKDRPLMVDASTGLPYVLRLIHRHEGVSAVRGKELACPDVVPGDMLELGRRFGLLPASEPLSPEEAVKAEALRPYLLAAMIFLGKCPQPARLLRELKRRGKARRTI